MILVPCASKKLENLNHNKAKQANSCIFLHKLLVATIPKNDYRRGSINIVSFHEMLTVKNQLMNDLGQAPIFLTKCERHLELFFH